MDNNQLVIGIVDYSSNHLSRLFTLSNYLHTLASNV